MANPNTATYKVGADLIFDASERAVMSNQGDSIGEVVFSPLTFSKNELESELHANELAKSELYEYGKLVTTVRAGFRRLVTAAQPEEGSDPAEESEADLVDSYELKRGYSPKKAKGVAQALTP